jgi:hypothetical protein
MTEAEWLAADNPEPMLRRFESKMTSRRVRLFACAWGNLVSRDFPHARCAEAILAAERFAEGLVDYSELIVAHTAAEKVWERLELEADHREKA